MLNQENIYQLILNENWTNILEILYNQKNEIEVDSMLNLAAETFVEEFFKKVESYPINRKDIEENLENLFLLHQGKFYILNSDNWKSLIIEIVRRKPLKEALDYARYFPNEEICIARLEEYKALNKKENSFKQTIHKNITMNWIEIYNRLFELINNQGDVASYFSGPRFINTIKEFEPYFPDYNQFIEQRNREGKSTSRKIFYYDILLELKEETKLKVVHRLLEILKPFQFEKVGKIEELLGKKKSTMETVPLPVLKKEQLDNPVVFISYSWDNEVHKQWILNLAERLSSNGIEVILDRYHLRPGKSLPHFVESSIKDADRIIIIFTPNYKLKADKRDGGVGYEYSIMNAELYKNQTSNEKIIPMLRSGGLEESIPTFMQQFIHIDIRNNENFETSYNDLLREIYNEPVIQKPMVGKKQIFEKKPD
ncbi:MAG: toll/interleukin-1 receptor domain-containing protein, partial [Bacteroidia bacterium]